MVAGRGGGEERRVGGEEMMPLSFWPQFNKSSLKAKKENILCTSGHKRMCSKIVLTQSM
jgi:hypothetical protein